LNEVKDKFSAVPHPTSLRAESKFISDIFVYDKHAQPTSTDNSPGEGRQRVDYNLAQFFDSANPSRSASGAGPDPHVPEGNARKVC
jgi:hypothetical protein